MAHLHSAIAAARPAAYCPTHFAFVASERSHPSKAALTETLAGTAATRVTCLHFLSSSMPTATEVN